MRLHSHWLNPKRMDDNIHEIILTHTFAVFPEVPYMTNVLKEMKPRDSGEEPGRKCCSHRPLCQKLCVQFIQWKHFIQDSILKATSGAISII